ncbi:hypothetical protein PCE1_004130 [Barthelona sp. PCE]
MGKLISRVLNALSRIEAKIVLIGLDSAGKTAIIKRLKYVDESSIDTRITVGFSATDLEIGSLKINCYDIGGQKTFRNLWNYYYDDTDAVVFVIDSADVNRLNCGGVGCEEGCVKCVLHESLSDPRLAECTVLLLINKQDLPDALDPREVVKVVELDKLTQTWFAQPCSALNDVRSIYLGFDWLANELKRRK